MRVVKREWYNVARADTFSLIPLGDIHLGAAACDEKLLAAVVAEIAADPNCYWVGMGDFCEFVNRSDKRFDPLALAPWLQVAHLADLPKAQLDRFLSIVEPIAGKCLGLVEGNHEYAIRAKYERDIYSDIVGGIKHAGNFPADYPLALGVYGWLLLAFHSGPDKSRRSAAIRVMVHHGATGGKLEGSKALTLQRLLWIHDADLILVGHAHNTLTEAQDSVGLDRAGNPQFRVRKGAYCGSFYGKWAGADTYAERKGYYHAPVGVIRVTLRPCAEQQQDRVTITV